MNHALRKLCKRTMTESTLDLKSIHIQLGITSHMVASQTLRPGRACLLVVITI